MYWNWEQDLSIAARFEAVVRAFPHHVALRHGAAQMTYAELNAAANRIAHTILNQTQAAESPVALLLDHGISIIAAVLGTLKAGHAYSALSPSFPLARNKILVEDLQPALILTDTANHVPAQQLATETCRVVNVNEIQTRVNENPTLSLSPDTLAAIHYTSGSTGAPKGVVRGQRELLLRAEMDADYFHITPQTVSAMVYICSFAGSIRDLFDNLLNGATLSLYDIQQRGLAPMAAWLQDHQISSLHINATVLHQFLDQLPRDTLFAKLELVCPAQRFHRTDLQRLWSCLPTSARVIHQFAATEAGPICAIRLTREHAIQGDIIPIGSPLPNVHVQLIDPSGRTAAPNEVAELWVSSPYVARGFWRKPELTAERFVADTTNPHLRTYRTGDLARMRPDGLFELVGRNDANVKIRGYQVPLGAVRSTLEQSGYVREAEVIAIPDAAGDQQLIAYLVPKQPARGLKRMIRRTLEAQLPAYMIPARMVVLKQMPRLENGKVDRASLPPPNSTSGDADVPFVEPRTPIEKSVAEIWAVVLGLDSVGIHDNFLDLGGDSLRAAQIASRIQQALQTDIPLPTLLMTPTIAEIALIIAYDRAAQANGDELGQILDALEAVPDDHAVRP